MTIDREGRDLSCPKGKCYMATNPGQKIRDGLEALNKKVDEAVDSLLSDADKEHVRTLNGAYKLKGVIVESWAKSNDMLEDYINQLTNGGPPLDDK